MPGGGMYGGLLGPDCPGGPHPPGGGPPEDPPGPGIGPRGSPVPGGPICNRIIISSNYETFFCMICFHYTWQYIERT